MAELLYLMYWKTSITAQNLRPGICNEICFYWFWRCLNAEGTPINRNEVPRKPSKRFHYLFDPERENHSTHGWVWRFVSYETGKVRAWHSDYSCERIISWKLQTSDDTNEADWMLELPNRESPHALCQGSRQFNKFETMSAWLWLGIACWCDPPHRW